MRVEFDEQPNNRVKRKAKKRSGGIHFFVFFLMIAFSAVIALCLTVWFNVNSIEVIGNTEYSAEQIIAASGINVEDNLFRIDISEAETSIEKNLPYISDVKITKRLPGTVKLTVTPAVEYAYISQNVGSVIIDSDLKVLRDFSEPLDGVMHLKGTDFDTYTVGQRLEFKNSEQNSALKELFDVINEQGLNEGEYTVTMVDVSDVLDLKFIINDIYYVKVGSLNNVDKKIIHLKAMFPHMDKSQSAEIDLSGWTEENKQTNYKFCEIDEFK